MLGMLSLKTAGLSLFAGPIPGVGSRYSYCATTRLRAKGSNSPKSQNRNTNGESGRQRTDQHE